MKAPKPLDHELSDAALDLQAQRWAEQAEARSRQRAILDARKKEWRNAPPQASGLKPFSDVWFDVDAQHGGAITEDRFWDQVIRTIHEGFFDQDHRLLSIIDDETRVTRETLKYTFQWNENGGNQSLIHAIVRNSWATIETLSEWARHQRYEIPLAWQSVIPRIVQGESASDPLDSITRPKVRAATKALRALKLPQGMSNTRRLEKVNKYLMEYEDGMTITRHTLDEARNALKLAEMTAQNCPKLP